MVAVLQRICHGCCSIEDLSWVLFYRGFIMGAVLQRISEGISIVYLL